MPTPHVNEWVKTTPYGDYTNEKDNHKKSSRCTEQYHLVQSLKSRHRHCGSKNLHSLRSNFN